MTRMIDGVAHGTDDDRVTYCGLSVPPDAPEWRDDFDGAPVCSTCKRLDDEGALREAQLWLEAVPDTRAFVGPCGKHLLALTRADDPMNDRHMMIMMRGTRLITPTAEQFVGMLEGARCAACSVQ